MLHLAWQELRRRPGTLLGAMVMTAIGAALIASFVVMYSSIEETRAPVGRYAGVPVVTVGSPGMFTPQMVHDIAAIEGVEDVVPELSFPAQVLTASGAPVVPQLDIAQFGHSWDGAVLTPFQLTAGVSPSGPGEMVVDQALARQAGIGVGERTGRYRRGRPVLHRLRCGRTTPQPAAPARTVLHPGTGGRPRRAR